jgi:hypothetical protein
MITLILLQRAFCATATNHPAYACWSGHYSILRLQVLVQDVGQLFLWQGRTC